MVIDRPYSAPRFISNPGQIWLQLAVVVFDCPEVQRQAGQFVHFRNGSNVTRAIDDDQITAANFAYPQSKMRKVFGGKSRKLFFGRLVAAGTPRARKWPAAQAKRADDFESESLALRPQASGLRRAFAPWTVEATRKIPGIWLQHRSRKKL